MQHHQGPGRPSGAIWPLPGPGGTAKDRWRGLLVLTGLLLQGRNVGQVGLIKPHHVQNDLSAEKQESHYFSDQLISNSGD